MEEETPTIEVIPPPYVLTDDDQRGLVVVITAVTLSFVWTCLLIRIWLRNKTREWKSDDYFLAGATVLDTVQSGIMFHIVGDGLGRSQESLSVLDLSRIGKSEFGSQIIYIFTLLLSKCAVLLLYMRLSPDKGLTLVSRITIAVSTVWALAAIILIAVPCNPSQFWSDGPDKCSNIWPRWQAIGAIDIITEAIIFMTSVYLVAPLKMKTKSKAMVVGAFSARLPVIVASAFRLYYLERMLHADDRTLEGAYYVTATQWHIGYAIMSSTITGLGPFLRPFSKSFSTSYRRSSYSHHPSMPSSTGDSHTESHTHHDTYQMQHLKANKANGPTTSGPNNTSSTLRANESASKNHSDHSSLSLRPDTDGFEHNTAVSGGRRVPSAGDESDAISRMSNESQQWIIKKKTELKVETDRVSHLRRG